MQNASISNVVSESAKIAAIAVIVWFILSAARRMVGDSVKFPGAPALLAIERLKALPWFLALEIFGWTDYSPYVHRPYV